MSKRDKNKKGQNKEQKEDKIKSLLDASEGFDGIGNVVILILQIVLLIIFIGIVINLGINLFKPVLYPNELPVLTNLRQVEDSEYFIYDYEIKKDIINNHLDVVDKRIKMNKRKIFKKKYIYAYLKEYNGVYSLNHISLERDKDSNYKEIKINIKDNGDIKVHNFQEYTTAEFLKAKGLNGVSTNIKYEVLIELLPSESKVKKINEYNKVPIKDQTNSKVIEEVEDIDDLNRFFD